jgi:ATP-binding cassette subfamily B protein
VQFNGYLMMLAWPMIALGWVVSLYQQGAASMHRIREMMGQRPKIHHHHPR